MTTDLAERRALDDRHSVNSVYRLIVLVTLLKPLSNVFLAWGMQRMPATVTEHPQYLIQALFEPLVIIGVLLQIGWLLLRMSLLSVADLSYVLPVTAAGYVISTFLGRVVLHEHVSLARWAGAILISAGTALVVSTPRLTSEPGEDAK